jgi:hypothetical protein
VSSDHASVPAVVEVAAPMRSSAIHSSLAVPVAIANAGDQAARRFLEFFAVTIRNKNTRLAYYRAACNFFVWLEKHGERRPDDVARRRVEGRSDPPDDHCIAAASE